MEYKFEMWLRQRQSDDVVDYKIAKYGKAVKEYEKAQNQFERKLANDFETNPTHM
jgi:hypothetical protein